MANLSRPRRAPALALPLALALALAAASCSSGAPGATHQATPPGSPTTGPSDTTSTTVTTPGPSTASDTTAKPGSASRAPAATGRPGQALPPLPAVRPPTPPDTGTWAMGAWQPAGRPVGGSAAVLTNTLQHTPGGASLAVAQLDTSRLRVALYDGTAPAHDTVPPSLVATFNSGFQFNQARGGMVVDGVTTVPLRTGSASLVVYTDGSATVGQWGRDVQMANVVSVRQNLELMVDGGRPAAGLTGPSSSLLATWGYTLGNVIVTWRSAVGVDAAGHLLYAAGAALDPVTLASGLVAAGAVRAMELDINPAWVSFNTFTGATVGTKLMPTMNFPPDHYLTTTAGRDFFAVFAR